MQSYSSTRMCVCVIMNVYNSTVLLHVYVCMLIIGVYSSITVGETEAVTKDSLFSKHINTHSQNLPTQEGLASVAVM